MEIKNSSPCALFILLLKTRLGAIWKAYLVCWCKPTSRVGLKTLVLPNNRLLLLQVEHLAAENQAAVQAIREESQEELTQALAAAKEQHEKEVRRQHPQLHAARHCIGFFPWTLDVRNEWELALGVPCCSCMSSSAQQFVTWCDIENELADVW